MIRFALALVLAVAPLPAPRPVHQPDVSVTVGLTAGGRTAAPRVVGGGAPSPAAVPPVAVTLRGIASWFAAPSGTAAAGPALRRALGPGWRGMRVRVTAGGRSVVVRLTDWMARDRLVDLSDDAFRRLAPLSVGLVRVEIP